MHLFIQLDFDLNQKRILIRILLSKIIRNLEDFFLKLEHCLLFQMIHVDSFMKFGYIKTSKALMCVIFLARQHTRRNVIAEHVRVTDDCMSRICVSVRERSFLKFFSD